ncbi:hypothetical protein [Acidocella facilis]|uniref:hypothetical protein n=1 Tax=Acidocella facilis TaxID=525 RepID=UPI001F35086D|nr:hypothetical protein [Acidocella facilis]
MSDNQTTGNLTAADAYIGVEEDADQELSFTDHCTHFRCDKAELVLNGAFWYCPVCMSSYGSETLRPSQG